MIPVKKILGYGGAGSINTTQLLISGGSFDMGRQISYLNMISTPPDATSASRIQHADGIRGYMGSISFDVTSFAMGLFTVSNGLLQRNWTFNVGISDGNDTWQMVGCKATNLSMSGSAGGLLSAQVSYVGKTGKQFGAPMAYAFIRDTNIPMGYWNTGTADDDDNVREWTFTMSQEATPVYLNVSNLAPEPEDPAYIKIGLVSYKLDVTTYKNIFPSLTSAPIIIATDTFTLTGRTLGTGFSFGGITDLGTYSYTFETSSQNGWSDGLVISQS